MALRGEQRLTTITSDEALISHAIVENDTQAFDRLVQRYHSRVRGWLRYLCRDAAVADDLAQETFFKAWRRLSSFKGNGSFEAWLFTIARNEFLQQHRKSGREAGHLEQLELQASPGAGADDESKYQGESTDANRFLGILGNGEREVMILVYGLGLSHSEASDVSGLPLGTVKSHVRRSVTKIRDRFGLEAFGNG